MVKGADPPVSKAITTVSAEVLAQIAADEAAERAAIRRLRTPEMRAQCRAQSFMNDATHPDIWAENWPTAQAAPANAALAYQREFLPVPAEIAARVRRWA